VNIIKKRKIEFEFVGQSPKQKKILIKIKTKNLAGESLTSWEESFLKEKPGILKTFKLKDEGSN